MLVLDTTRASCRGLENLGATLLSELRDLPEAPFIYRLEYWCKDTGNIRVAAVSLNIGSQVVKCYWKLVQARGLFVRLGAMLRRSRVRKAWDMGRALLACGIATPEPMAFVEVTDGLTVRQGLLTAAIPDTMQLKVFLNEIYPRMPPEEQRVWRIAITAQLADELRALHERRFDHRDLKASNILVSLNSEHPQVWLLDLDAVRRWPWLPRQRVIQNLARLNVSCIAWGLKAPSDRVRFLRNYLGENWSGEWKLLWRRVRHRSEQKIWLTRRKARPLH